MDILQNSKLNPSLISEILCPVAILMYMIWYVRNLIHFRGHKPDIAYTLQLVRHWQNSYNLTNYQYFQAKIVHRREQSSHIFEGIPNNIMSHQLWLKGICRGNKKYKRSIIKSVLIIQGQKHEIGIYRHDGSTSTDKVIWKVLREYLSLWQQNHLLNIHFCFHSHHIKMCINGKQSHREFKNVWYDIRSLLSLQGSSIMLHRNERAKMFDFRNLRCILFSRCYLSTP